MDALAHVVRLLRNFLHPGRILREKSSINIERTEAELANSVLLVLNYIISQTENTKKEA